MTSYRGEKTGDHSATPTLRVGGGTRAGAAYRPVPGDECDAVGCMQHAETVLTVSLAELPDAWRTLRAVWHWVSPLGVLTVFAGKGLARADAEKLLLLAGFEPFLAEQTHDGLRLRARRLARTARPFTCSVIIPCKNEVGNVDHVVSRVPNLGTHTEIIFVDGQSDDGTPERLRHLITVHRDRDIKFYTQDSGGGKAAAVRLGFDVALGDVVMILDADMTVAPEDLPRFYQALAEGVTDFANGTRFAYPMQRGAMRFPNRIGNRVFGVFLSWLLGTSITDSLCGTKALLKADWRRVAATRPLFGSHDPWGDFDLLLGARKVGLHISEVPVRYYARTAGESKMQPFRHGLALARTCAAGIRHLRLTADRPVRRR